jgi:hypothetical protein
LPQELYALSFQKKGVVFGIIGWMTILEENKVKVNIKN